MLLWYIITYYYYIQQGSSCLLPLISFLFLSVSEIVSAAMRETERYDAAGPQNTLPTAQQLPSLSDAEILRSTKCSTSSHDNLGSED